MSKFIFEKLQLNFVINKGQHMFKNNTKKIQIYGISYFSFFKLYFIRKCLRIHKL